MVNNAREAIGIATTVIKEAGYVVVRITNVEYDEDEELWKVSAYSGDTEIELTINENDEVEDFTTN